MLSELTFQFNETNENPFFDDNYEILQKFEVPNFSHFFILFLQVLFISNHKLEC